MDLHQRIRSLNSSCCMSIPFTGYGFDHEVSYSPKADPFTALTSPMKWEVFTGSKNDPENPHQVAKVCYTAAIVFAALTLLCGCQIGVHSRVAKGGNIHL
ncbi:hypothetical protein FRC19_009207 [Serendipita sp. 401]|nr:hypothetical protein FRC19_009207 [Serendipita sp. 401]